MSQNFYRQRIRGTTPMDIKNMDDNFEKLFQYITGNLNGVVLGGSDVILANIIAQTITATTLNGTNIKKGGVDVSVVGHQHTKASISDLQTIGNANGNIPLANGTLNTNLNADKVDGHEAADFALAAQVDTWHVPTYTNSWVTYGGTQNFAYMKDNLGFVHLRGIIKSGTIGSAAFTLPAGYLPATTIQQIANSNGAYGQFTITTGGVVTPVTGSNAWFSFDGVVFPTF